LANSLPGAIAVEKGAPFPKDRVQELRLGFGLGQPDHLHLAAKALREASLELSYFGNRVITELDQ
jgi:hypothetical protein